MKAIQGYRSVAAVAALMMGSIVSPRPSAAADCAGVTASEIKFETLEHYPSGPYQGSATMLIRSAQEWSQSTEALAAGGSLSLYPVDEPKVDWNEQAVVVIAMGERPSMGYDVEVVQVWKDGDAVIIGVRYVHPAPGSYQAALTSPYHMISFNAFGATRVEICETSGASPRIERRFNPPGDESPSESARITMTWSGVKSLIAP